jgi:hypothetical protein
MTDEIPSFLITQGKHSMKTGEITLTTSDSGGKSTSSKQAEDELYAEWKLFEDNMAKFLSEDNSKIEDPKSEEDYDRLARDAESTRMLIGRLEQLQNLLSNLANKKTND